LDSLTYDLAIAVAGGVIAGTVVIGLQALRQYLIDHWYLAPISADAEAWGGAANSVPSQIRVAVYNRASIPANLITTPRDDGGEVIQGWNNINPWGGDNIQGSVVVGAHSVQEFWVAWTTPPERQRCTEVELFVSFFTYVSGETVRVPVRARRYPR
jgi:hypothetical protein